MSLGGSGDQPNVLVRNYLSSGVQMKLRGVFLFLIVSVALCINACGHDNSLRWTEDV